MVPPACGCRARRRATASPSAIRWWRRISASASGNIITAQILGDLALSRQPELLWQPSERAIEEAQLTQFARQVIRKRKLEVASYPEFYQWSVENPEEFWSDVWDFGGVIASRKG